MSFVFRQITNAPAWDVDETYKVADTSDWDATSDILKSFATKTSALSIYFFDGSDAQLERLVAAFCANKDKVEHLDYVVARSSEFDELALELSDVPGEVPDEEVALWHKDVVNLSVKSLSRFALTFHRVGERKRLLASKIATLIKKSVANGCVQPNKLKPKLLEELQHKFK